MSTTHATSAASAAPARAASYDLTAIRRDFPALAQSSRGKPLVYLDNAATTQKPASVIAALTRFYEHDYANVHRGAYELSERATAAYEGARDTVRRFLNAPEREEIVFVRGATEGINLVAQSFARGRLAAGDEILVSAVEHHSNIVPWQLVAAATGARLRVVPVDDAGEIHVEEVASLIGPRTRLVAVAHVSNALGTVLPVREVVELAHARGVPVLVDGAQAVPHLGVDVRELGCDFYVFSGHKVYGPTGIGVVYGRRELLEETAPYQGGGDMIATVSFEGSTWADLPHKLEAGTPHIAGAVGLAAALEYVQGVGLDRIAAHEQRLLEQATRELAGVPGLRILGTAAHKAGVVSFVMEGIHPHDIATIADLHGVAIRAGHHCAQPVMQRFGVPATARASFGLYNAPEEIHVLIAALLEARRIFS